jgi:putative membrane protein
MGLRNFLKAPDRQIRLVNWSLLAAFILMVGIATQAYVSIARASGDQDSEFAGKAAAGGMAEVKLGQLAQQAGGVNLVKTFGQRMVTDHTLAGAQLKDAAQKENITLPLEMSAEDMALFNRLSQLSGPSFDREYARAMVKDHETDVAEFQKEISNGKNESIKQFAVQTLPTLTEHLKLAREMEKAVGNSGK